MKNDTVNHPEHYTSHPSGVECIDITEHYDFCIGNAIKYLWRAGLKTEEGKTDVQKELEDLKKAQWYIDRKIQKLGKESPKTSPKADDAVVTCNGGLLNPAEMFKWNIK